MYNPNFGNMIPLNIPQSTWDVINNRHIFSCVFLDIYLKLDTFPTVNIQPDSKNKRRLQYVHLKFSTHL